MAAVTTTTVAATHRAIVAKSQNIVTLKLEQAAWVSKLEGLRARYLEELKEVEDLEVELALLESPAAAPAPVAPAPIVRAIKRKAVPALDLDAVPELPNKKTKIRADGKENEVVGAPMTRSRSKREKRAVVKGLE